MSGYIISPVRFGKSSHILVTKLTARFTLTLFCKPDSSTGKIFQSHLCVQCVIQLAAIFTELHIHNTLSPIFSRPGPVSYSPSLHVKVIHQAELKTTRLQFAELAVKVM